MDLNAILDHHLTERPWNELVARQDPATVLLLYLKVLGYITKILTRNRIGCT
jgi:hypothetical protein